MVYRKGEKTAATKTDEPEGLTLIDLGDGKGRIVANLSTFEGQRYLEIRKWYQDREGMWGRTKNGLSVPVKIGLQIPGALEDYFSAIRKRAARKKQQK